MMEIFYFDIYDYLFSIITDPKTIVQFVTCNREIASICRKQMEQKKIQCGKVIEQIDFDNQKIKYTQLPNGDIHGKFHVFHYNGSLSSEMMYIDNRTVGIGQDWRKTGQLKSRSTYPNGLLEEWHKNGQLKRQQINFNGHANGVYRFWYENGQLWHEWNYREGKKYGSCKSWDENGVLIDEREYIDDGVQ